MGQPAAASPLLPSAAAQQPKRGARAASHGRGLLPSRRSPITAAWRSFQSRRRRGILVYSGLRLLFRRGLRIEPALPRYVLRVVVCIDFQPRIDA